MTRPLRIEFPGTIYHVTSRGEARRAIYRDDHDRQKWLDVLSLVCRRFNIVVHAYCQMTNHYHLMIETVDGNLSQAMRQLNSLYSQYFNRIHLQVGHVFQGRYKAILVQKQGYHLELARYVVLDPLRAGMVTHVEDWRWSSYNITTLNVECPPWFNSGWLLSQFSQSDACAVEAYRRFVCNGIGQTNPLNETRYQIVLGDQAFVAQHAERLGALDFTAVSKNQRRVTAKPCRNINRPVPPVMRRWLVHTRQQHLQWLRLVDISRWGTRL